MSKNGCGHCGRHPEEEAPACPDCGLEMPTQSQWQAMRRRRRRSLTLRLTRILPGYPAILLVPMVLGLWIWMWTVGREDPRGILVLDPKGSLAYKEVYGLPFVFVGPKPPPFGPGGWRPWAGYGFKPAPFLAGKIAPRADGRVRQLRSRRGARRCYAAGDPDGHDLPPAPIHAPGPRESRPWNGTRGLRSSGAGGGGLGDSRRRRSGDQPPPRPDASHPPPPPRPRSRGVAVVRRKGEGHIRAHAWFRACSGSARALETRAPLDLLRADSPPIPKTPLVGVLGGNLGEFSGAAAGGPTKSGR